MTSKELIKDIGANKHNVKMRLRMVVLDPIDSILNDGQVTIEFLLEQKKKITEVHEIATSIMNFFSRKWYDSEEDSEDVKLASLRSNINKTIDEIIPKIKDVIIPFYDICYNNTQYFKQPLANNDTYNFIQDSLNDYLSICIALKSLDHDDENGNITCTKVNLLEIIQKGLDKTPVAIVSYVNEFNMSQYYVNIDVDKFLNDVLLNIRSNIERHAFSTAEQKKRLITEKKVVVSVDEEDKDNLVISIQNNGTQFKGDYKQIFDYGYTSGKSGNEGKGMFSIKNTMKEIGGDVQFISEKGLVVYKLFIRK